MSTELTIRPPPGPLQNVPLGREVLQASTAIMSGDNGWYKVASRTNALLRILDTYNTSLVPSSSFNLARYKEARSANTVMHGLFIDNNNVHQQNIDDISTAIPRGENTQGVACLRALTTALMCLYGNEIVLQLLKELIPFGLLQPFQDGVEVRIEDQLFFSLRHWVESVSIEEDNGGIRDQLMAKASERETKLTGVSAETIERLRSSLESDIPFVLGFLKWVVARGKDPSLDRYSTRCLKVWTLASILTDLGFDTTPAQSLGEFSEVEEIFNRKRNADDSLPKVFLVAAGDNDGGSNDTDPGLGACDIPVLADESKPQIIAIERIPDLAFRHVCDEAEIERLRGIWNFSFMSACDNLSLPELIGGYKDRTFIRMDFRGVLPTVPDLHSRLLEPFLSHTMSQSGGTIAPLCSTAMQRYVPTQWSKHWNPNTISEFLESGVSLATAFASGSGSAEIKRNSNTLVAIALGTVIGACSKAITNLGSSFQADIAFVKATKIAMWPDIARPNQLKRLQNWVQFIVNLVLQDVKHYTGTFTIFEWLQFLLRVFSGENENIGEIRQSQALLGGHYNGITILSDHIVNPTVWPNAVLYVHINRGRLLNLPTTENGLVIGAALTYASRTTHGTTDAPDLPRIDCLQSFDKFDGHFMRIDPEPYWEGDPRTIFFKCRFKGLSLASISIGTNNCGVLASVACRCKCNKVERQTPINGQDRWRCMSIQDLVDVAPNKITFDSEDEPYGFNVLVDASSSVAATIFAINAFRWRPIVAWDCLACMAQEVRRLKGKSDLGFVCVIPWGFDQRAS